MPRRDDGRARHSGPPARPGPGARPTNLALAPSAAAMRAVPAPRARPEPARTHRPRLPRGVRTLLLGLATTLAVFALAVGLVTVLEVVVDHPLSGGAPGATTLGELIHPRLVGSP